ncbi:MAG: DUF1351 domain-containing protein [Bacteroidaceae bacterium]|nr:DUF1351 domain-containing protein [Bacteroidaceae bacterium]
MNQETNIPVPVAELQASQLELVVSEKTIGSLTTNAIQIRELVKQALPRYDIANYSSDDVAKAKADKALLNKAQKTLNDKRIEYEREFMAPFGEFKDVVGETCKLIKEAVAKIDTVIKADEERTKAEKREQIERLAESCGLEELGIHLSKIWNDKWLNKSTSLKSVEADIKARMTNITADLETLKSFAEDYDVLVVRYKENLNLQEAVRYANQLKEQREAAARATEEDKTKDEAAKPEQAAQAEAPEKPEEQSSHHDIDNFEADAADAFADILGQSAGAPKVAEPVTYPRYYEIFAKDEQFKALEAWLTQQGLNFNLQK